jgi:hypothetical protein
VTLDCPGECLYLQQARRVELPRDLGTLDPAAVFAEVEVGEDLIDAREPLIAGLSYTLVRAARRDRELKDADLIPVLTNMARSCETLVRSGLVYENASANPVQRNIASELENMIAEYRQLEQQHLGYSNLRDSELLKVLVFMVRVALCRTNGRPRSRAFIDYLTDSFPKEEEGIVTGGNSGPSLIVP